MAEERSPAFQFYFKDWRSSRKVQRMSFKERGMYLEMLIDQWDKGALPQRPEDIAALIGAKESEFLKSWPVLRSCFVEQAEGWVNLRLEAERTKQRIRKQRAAAWGKDGAEKRWAKPSSDNGHPIGTASEPNSFSIASADAIASAVACAGAVPTAPTEPNARSKRPIFTGQKLTVFEWQLDDCARTLGEFVDTFDLHDWFFTLDAQAMRMNLVIPKRDGGEWLQAQLVAEAQRRGLPLQMATMPQMGKGTTRLAAAVANIKAREAV